MKIEANSHPQLDEIESAIIDIFVRATKILGYPKSIGEIFGLLFVTKEPICMEDIIIRLGISLGAASQGLKQLKAINAVKTTHIIGQRRDYYFAETELDELLHRYFKLEFENHLDNWENQQTKIHQLSKILDAPEHLFERLTSLNALHSKSRDILKEIYRNLSEKEPTK